MPLVEYTPITAIAPIAFGALHQRLYRDLHENALGARTVHDRCAHLANGVGNCRDFHSSGSLWWHCGSGGNGTKRAQESALRYKCTSAPTETNIGAKTTDIKKKRTTWKATAAITLKENCFNLSKIILAEIKSHIEADVLARLTQSIDLKDLEGSSSLREEATEEPAKYCENILEKEGKLVV
ncbi:hypothetical protein PV328_003950 [Microctonus aethiopoides]|uniref:Uncharacterized protein n=1 Tax=Microctonus aethiopoides TaxID=144406 RepID=A0AA39F9H7_9HYME|nr:hypothetical protein PV328_003950 [Microctonus aethiopoides]